ncbi:arylformamidase [Bacillus massilinigeriensis]|uniref:arylformamidase n=1 Tax=Bacillus mediterraneensis TaxID=1805474 RepID=UPI0008F8DA1C|nr:arylformamidase [Bacillus mediterraneensis]
MGEKKWMDISQPLSDNIGHWPGDTPFRYETAFTKETTGSVNIGRMMTSLHTGTHVDAPFHFDNDGERILDMDIGVFIGRARVVDVSTADVIDAKLLENLQIGDVERLLLKTAIPNIPERFPERIPLLAPDLAPFLAERGVVLLGVDVPSVDQLDSKDMETHHALYANGISILENLMLDKVDEGEYELIALPLPLKDGDGSPVRAVIRPL